MRDDLHLHERKIRVLYDGRFYIEHGRLRKEVVAGGRISATKSKE
jgi:hypothetical protein